jgi:hypothetical protein
VDAAFLFWLLIPVFFVVWAAWIWRVWPERNPFDDETWERRSEGHFRGEGRR